MLPAAGTRFPPGYEPSTLAKTHNSLYLWRLVNSEGNDVGRGEPGEIAVRGPTVFSGYWNAQEANEKAFSGGWFHILMADPAVAEAVVVKRSDAVWGEVPVAFVVPQAANVTSEYLMQVCRAGLSSYKCPREIRLIKSQDEFPRSTSGKVQRQIVEQWLKQT